MYTWRPCGFKNACRCGKPLGNVAFVLYGTADNVKAAFIVQPIVKLLFAAFVYELRAYNFAFVVYDADM